MTFVSMAASTPGESRRTADQYTVQYTIHNTVHSTIRIMYLMYPRSNQSHAGEEYCFKNQQSEGSLVCQVTSGSGMNRLYRKKYFSS